MRGIILNSILNKRPLARLDRWEQILGMRNGEPQVYTEVHEDSSTANDNEDASDIESCKRSKVYSWKTGKDSLEK
jgi:hypothetical protein